MVKHHTIQEKLDGTWKLVSYKVKNDNGRITYPLGEDATGIAIYTADGYMSVQIMKQGRLEYASGDLHKGPQSAMAAAAKGYLSYAGTYQVLDEGNVIEYDMEISLNPNWHGEKQPRFISFEDNKLTINSQPVFIDGMEQNTQIVWERVSH